MYKRQLLELIRVNLLYVNPQLTNKAREKGKKGIFFHKDIFLDFSEDSG